ncbi:hypothetical protein [Saccharopolyspora sp. SCSIO 74807]|uniref:hypothetical protein n=1 Tax=Saccharopolyspora sp. SCSIO 74807 TaxID=3118084 RepID=UPI0030D39433
MSGEQRRPDAPRSGAPWSPELVAELHAGMLDQATVDELLPRIEADPEARELLAALEATTSDLAALPDVTMPGDVAARLDTALDEEIRTRSAQQGAPQPPTADGAATDPHGGQVVDFAAARSRRRRRYGRSAAMVTAAAAVTGVVVLASTLFGAGGGQQAANAPEPAQGPPPLALSGDRPTLAPDQLGEVLGTKRYGALTDPGRLLGCLQANGVRSGNPLGAREVTINGEPAQLLVLQGGGIGRFRLLVVGPECGPDRPATISDSTLGS